MHLTRHWREITLTSTLLWQSIEFTSYDPEYCWPGLCLTHSKKCTINITITHKALHNTTYSNSPLFVHMIINNPINIQMQKPTLGQNHGIMVIACINICTLYIGLWFDSHMVCPFSLFICSLTNLSPIVLFN